ncbi:MAG TPA: PH domain-containing protein [Acidimicrobiales bacterium]|nr:PH domain-containing protein [Acidimicrobiales bacterium]
MGYPTRLLNDGEEIVLDLKPHWMYIVPTIIVWLGVTLLCLVLWNVSGQDWMKWVTLIAFLALGVNAAVRYSKWTTTSFTVTNDRIIFRQGMFAKSGVEIPLERIMNVNFKQSIWERIVGAGDLLIESGGKDGQSRFSDIRKPELVGKEIHEQANQYEEKPARRAAAASAAASNLPPPPAPGAPAGPASGDATEQLAKLHDLLTKGAITQAEYDTKKAELLNRL